MNNRNHKHFSYPGAVDRLRPIAVATLLAFFWSFVVTPAAMAQQMSMPDTQMGSPAKVKLSPLVTHPAPTVAHLPDGRTISLLPHKPGPALPAFDYLAAARAHPLSTADNVSNPARRAWKGTPVTLLDLYGQLPMRVSPRQLAAWQTEANNPKTPAARQAQVNVWLGEIAMVRAQQPLVARHYFRLAELLSPISSPVHGVAAYDNAYCLIRSGAYREAQDAFQLLVQPSTRLNGYNHAIAALWLRHAGACVGYHQLRTDAGIPEPIRLDPLCAASGLAAAMRAMGRPYDKATILRACKVTGYGSSLLDVVNAGPALGVDIRAVAADDAGLIALPKPAIAYVEHDHFIAVIKADTHGVSYLCSDCGPWPGGRVNLTWKQWHMLEPGAYAVVTKPGSAWDRALSALPRLNTETQADIAAASLGLVPSERLSEGSVPEVRVATVGSLQGLLTQPAQSITTINPAILHLHIQRLNLSVALFGLCAPVGPSDLFCHLFGMCPTGPKPTSKSGCKLKGPSAGDPVNLATGDLDDEPPVDLTVYNPVGPSVVWQRYYDSLRNEELSSSLTGTPTSYEFTDYGGGWSRSYNACICDPNFGQAGPSITKYLVMPNGSLITFTAPTLPTAGNPVQCTVQPGADVKIQWNYSSDGDGTWTITWPDRTVWTTGNMLGGLYCFALTRIADRNGNAITLNYTAYQNNDVWPLLTSITNSAGTALLTINRSYNGTNSISSVTDCYGRSVYYDVEPMANDNLGETVLTHVSQVVANCSGTAPDRYVYSYELSGGGGAYQLAQFAVLHTVTVPSPTGTGSSTETIDYNASAYVADTIDGNGNETLYYASDGSGNPVQGATAFETVVQNDSGNHTLYKYTVGFDSNMDQTTVTNGAEVVTATNTYSDPNDPHMPSSVADAFGHTANYSYDQYGNVLTATDPRGTLTTNTFSYTNFPLGELTSTKAGSKQATTLTYYEPSGNVHQINTPTPGTVGGSSTVATSFAYDTLGNVTSTTAPGNATSSTVTSTFGYTSDGSYNQSEAVGEALTETDNLGHVTHFRYDSQGNVLNVTDALGNKNAFTYNIVNDPLTTALPASGESGTGQGYVQESYQYPGGPLASQYVFDESGNQIRTVSCGYGLEGETLSVGGSTESVTFTYDGLYRIKTLTDGNGHTTSYAYNTTTGDVATISYPGANTGTGFDIVSYPSYDAEGDPLKRIDGRSIETDYIYNDPDNLLTNINYPSTSNLDTSFTYDGYGRVSGITDGAAASATGSGIVPTYDDDNETTSVQTTYVGQTAGTYLPTQTISYTYNSDGSRATMVTPSGTFTYGYDGAGRPNSLTDPFSETTTWNYLNNNWLASRTMQNGVSTNYTYNVLGQILDQNTKNSSNSVLTDYSVSATGGYDGEGNILSRTDTISGLSTYSGSNSYSFDTKDQLTEEYSTRAGGYTNSYVYDQNIVTGAGNPTSFKGVANTFNTDNQYTDTGYTYDGNGNPTTYKGTNLTFDTEDRMTSFGTALTNGYLESGLRAWKQNSAGIRTYFIYDGISPVCELSSTGAVTATNTFGTFGLISRRVGSASTFYTFDLQGGNAQRLDQSGNNIASAMYDAFGTRASTDGSTDPFSGYGAEWGYYSDSETAATNGGTALELCTYRFYDPTNGRCLNRDPAGYVGGPNLYEYGENGPQRFSDALGTDCDELRQQIEDVTNELAERYGDMLDDSNPLNETPLYPYRNAPAPPGQWGKNPNDPGKGSWYGHQEQYEGKQRQLKKLLKEWEDGPCGGPGDFSQSWDWVNLPAPSTPRPASDYNFTPSPQHLQLPFSQPNPSTPTAIIGGGSVVAIVVALLAAA